MSKGWRPAYTIQWGRRVSALTHELPRVKRSSLQMTAKAMTLKTVVCSSESPSGWKDANATCSKCERRIWCHPLFEGAAEKLCVKCAM